MQNKIRPLSHLQAAGKLYPNAWKQIESMIADKGKGLPDWPEWCFLPIAGFYSIVSADSGLDRLTPELIPDVARLAAIGTWRYTQGIYRFDDDLRRELCDTELTGDMPSDVFHRLPEYCIYVETPGIICFTMPVHGFWCHLESDANTGREELRLLLDTETMLLPVPLHLGSWSLLEAIKKADIETAKHVPALPKDLMQKERASDLQPLLSMILYLCSDMPEVQDDREPGSSPGKPSMVKTRHGFRLFPPDRPRIWQVGREIGIKLRSAGNVSRQEGYTVRPHIRRAHWHGFWKGPKKGERTFFYHWLPPMLVSGSET